jgi:hypothetical protein
VGPDRHREQCFRSIQDRNRRHRSGCSQLLLQRQRQSQPVKQWNVPEWLSLVLTFDSYATKLEATLDDGILTGTYGGSSGNAYAFQAKRRDPSLVASSDQHPPDISGLCDRSGPTWSMLTPDELGGQLVIRANPEVVRPRDGRGLPV